MLFIRFYNKCIWNSEHPVLLQRYQKGQFGNEIICKIAIRIITVAVKSAGAHTKVKHFHHLEPQQVIDNKTRFEVHLVFGLTTKLWSEGELNVPQPEFCTSTNCGLKWRVSNNMEPRLC